MMTSFLICSHQHHKSGATSDEMLLSNVIKNCPLPTQIWLHMQLTRKQSLIVQFATYNFGEKLICHIGTRQAQSHEVQSCVALFVFHYIYFLFCKGLEMMGSDKICTASHTYIHTYIHTYMFCPYVISTPLLVTWRVTNENLLPKDTSLVHSSHNFTLKRNELRYHHCCLSQLYFIGH
jgi:hypothetical protein